MLESIVIRLVTVAKYIDPNIAYIDLEIDEKIDQVNLDIDHLEHLNLGVCCRNLNHCII